MSSIPCRMLTLILLMVPCFMLTHGTSWTTVMRSAHHKNSSVVTQIDGSIVTSSFTSVTWLHCSQRCTRTEGILSLYYETAEQTCYCNKQEDNNAITGTNGIIYSPLSTKLDVQVEAGKQRYVLPEGTYTSCADIFTSGYRSSGSYVINHAISTASSEIYCNMDYPDWTVFQRRFDGTVDFYRNWNAYVNGFGSTSGEFWLGLETVYRATDKLHCELLILMEAESNNSVQATGYARYGTFSIGNNVTKYVLEVKTFSGDVGDALEVHNGMMFSTYDVDNDLSVSDCAEMFHGAWWYESCHSSNLNGRYLAGDHSTFGDGMIWRQTWGYYYSLLKTEMMFKCN